MARTPEIGNVQLYPQRPLRKSDKNGFVLKFYCPIRGKRVRKNCGTRERREARRTQRICRERLLNGEYESSGGAITKDQVNRKDVNAGFQMYGGASEKSWDAAFEQYRNHRKRRRKSSQDSNSRIAIAGRIFETRRANENLPAGATLRECSTLDSMEYLQDKLLDGAEGRYESRSPNTVNSMMAAIMAFVRYCYDHEWIDRVPPAKKLDVDEVMRGRPITGEEFDRMVAAVPKVVGDGPAPSWQFALQLLWESGFRVADLMTFSWDNERKIHPVWPQRQSEHPTIVIASTQKNRKVEEIPMLPDLQTLLEQVPAYERAGFVADPRPIEYEMCSQGNWFAPLSEDLEVLVEKYSNCAIARACGVTETTVRNWLNRLVIERRGKIMDYGREVPEQIVKQMRERCLPKKHQRSSRRLSSQRVSEIICAIGQKAGVVVRQPDEETGQRIKFASAHDLRRSLAERLINAGVSAETLMVIMRHKDFATTRKFYGARRAAQSAATEIHQQLGTDVELNALVGG
ncbi:MAG: site-specific integrase [Planctomycetes bacterium]|nr:site-specific integrase [Planctomycetota bacterium]